ALTSGCPDSSQMPGALLRDQILRNLLFSLAAALLLFASPSRAASVTARDGDTIQIGDVTYRLDGIDAPELDQICINDQADPFACGIDARDRLTKMIGDRSVHCDDLGPEKVYPN